MWLYQVCASRPPLVSIWVVSSLLLLNSAAMDRLCSCFFIFCYCIFGTDSRSGIAGLKGNWIYNFARSSQTLLHRGVPFGFPTAIYEKVCLPVACAADRVGHVPTWWVRCGYLHGALICISLIMGTFKVFLYVTQPSTGPINTFLSFLQLV